MNTKERPTTIWNRPWQGLRAGLAWFGLLTLAAFIIIFCIGLLIDTRHIGGLAQSALVLAAVVAFLLTAGVLLVRWLCCWRHLRWFLFAVFCLVTLLALAIAEENWRGKHAWERQRREWEAQGEKFKITELTPPPVPDDKNFAMCPLLKPILDYTEPPNGRVVWGDTNGQQRVRDIQAELTPPRNTDDHLVLGSLEKGTLADLPACAAFYRGNTNYPQAPANASPAQTILVALGKFDAQLDDLRQAAATRPYSRFPVHYDYQPAWAILLPHLSTVRLLTQVEHVHALAELEAGRPADAFKDLQLGFRLSDSIHEEPLLISHLVRIAALAIDLQTIREGLVRHAWTEPQLTELETNLAGLNLLGELKNTLRGEQAFEVESLQYLVQQRSLSRNPLDEVGNNNTPNPPVQWFPRGWYYQNMLSLGRMLHEYFFPAVDAESHRIFPGITERGEAEVTQMHFGPYTFFVRIFLPALSKPVERSARNQTYVDAARVACALERYRMAQGALPETLDALVPRFIDRIPNDVVDGKPLRYRRESDGGYRLYSVGWNQTDDGGNIGWSKKEKKARVFAPTQGDWVWQMPR